MCYPKKVGGGAKHAMFGIRQVVKYGWQVVRKWWDLKTKAK